MLIIPGTCLLNREQIVIPGQVTNEKRSEGTRWLREGLPGSGHTG